MSAALPAPKEQDHQQCEDDHHQGRVGRPLTWDGVGSLATLTGDRSAIGRASLRPPYERAEPRVALSGALRDTERRSPSAAAP